VEPVVFSDVLKANEIDTIYDLERLHIARVRDYMEKAGSTIYAIKLNKKGDKVIIKDFGICSDMPMASVTGLASDELAATIFSDFYLPREFPGIKTDLLILKHSSISDFEFEDDYFKTRSKMLFSNDKVIRNRDFAKRIQDFFS